MKLSGQATLLQIFMGESDRIDGKVAYEQIVLEARRLNLAGATVTRGLMGFGAHSRLHTAKILRLSEDLPIVIAIVDTPEKIQLLMPYLDQHVDEGLITMEHVEVVRYTAGK